MSWGGMPNEEKNQIWISLMMIPNRLRKILSSWFAWGSG